jgi:hypothetical protein
VHVPHEKIWQNDIANSGDGTRTLMCVAFAATACTMKASPTDQPERRDTAPSLL